MCNLFWTDLSHSTKHLWQKILRRRNVLRTSLIYFCCNWFPTNNTKSMFTSTNLALCLLLTCFYYYVPFLAVDYFCNNYTCNYLYIMLRSLWQSNLHATAVYVSTYRTFRHYRNSRYVRVFSIVTRTLSLKIASLQTGLIS